MKYTAIWTAPKWPYVNPAQDIAAEKEEIKGGLSSLSEKIRERGNDPEEVATERAERQKLEREWSPKVSAAQEFEQLKASAKRSPTHLVAAMKALGFGEDDLEPAAQVLYAFSKAGAADPARKAHAERIGAMLAEVGVVAVVVTGDVAPKRREQRLAALIHSIAHLHTRHFLGVFVQIGRAHV